MKIQRTHNGPRLSPRLEEVDLPAGRIYEVALERPPWHTVIGRSVIGLVRGIILQDDPLPMVRVHVQRKDDHSVVRSSRVRTAGERNAITKMFQDDLDRMTVGDFFRRYVRDPGAAAAVVTWRQAELEVMVRKAAESTGVPVPKVRVIRTPGIAATHVRITKAGSLFFDTRLVSWAPRTVVADVVAHEVGHLAQGWRTLVHHVGSATVILLAAGALVWGAAYGYGLVFAWVALAVAVALSVSVVAYGWWARRLELDADRTALKLVGTDVHLAALTWLRGHYAGSPRPLPLMTRLLHPSLSLEERAALARDHLSGPGPLALTLRADDS